MLFGTIRYDIILSVKICTPATTANIGPGFDLYGLSYKYYDEFIITPSDIFDMKSSEAEQEKYNNEHNLFFATFKKVASLIGLSENKKCKVNLSNHYPFSRGLGSSASIIVAGAYAANNLYKNEANKELTKNEIFKIATEIEGHPDNVAPCIFGGVNVSMIENENIYRKKFLVNENIHATLFIPPYETSTKEVRAILKKEVSLKDAIQNVGHAVFLIDALTSGDIEMLKFAIEDNFHVQYRKNLIKDFDDMKYVCENENKNTAFTISGSGSTCVCFSDDRKLGDKVKNKLQNKEIKILDVDFDNEGVICNL